MARFNKKTDEYATLSSFGHIATYMIPEVTQHLYPTNLDYFWAKCK